MNKQRGLDNCSQRKDKKKREDITLVYKATIRGTIESGGQDRQAGPSGQTDRTEWTRARIWPCAVWDHNSSTTKRNVR